MGLSREVFMHSNQHPDRSRQPKAPFPSRPRTRILWTSGFALLAAIAFFTVAVQGGQSNPGLTNPDKPLLSPEANRLPDKNDQMKLNEQQAKQQSFEAANAQRKKQISDDSAKLLTLAMALKAEVDKTNKDMLSLNVIRKADEIEKLARNVKDKMKLSVGGSGN
jgi:hypothetical protein